MTGARTAETYLYGYNKYPYNLIGPATVLWHADPSLVASAQPSAISRGKQGKGKGKQKAAAEEQNDPKHRTRVVWVRVHPTVTELAHEAIRLSASFALGAAKQAGRKAEVEIADLREQFNIFDIVGPKSSQVIKGALKPVDDKREDFKKVASYYYSWFTLTDARAVLGFFEPHTICRLCPPRDGHWFYRSRPAFKASIQVSVGDGSLTVMGSFPPKNVKLNIDEGTNLSPASTVFPSSVLAQSEIWRENTRLALRKPRYQKKDIDQRRSSVSFLSCLHNRRLYMFLKNLVPGTSLKSERKDDRIPVLLIQRSIENAPLSLDSTSSSAATTTPLHGWTLIVPQGWGMPFFSSLTYTGTRVGGQRECQTQAFEAGCAHFPRDFPCTEAYADYADDRADTDRAAWTRRPPAKRPNYDKLDTRSPWRADWGVVLGLEAPPAPEELEDFVDTQREPESPAGAPPGTEAEATAEGGEEAGPPTMGKDTPWLLRGPDVPALVAEVAPMLSPTSGLLVHVNQTRIKRRLDPLGAGVFSEDLMRGALVQVSIALCGRGCPDDLAVVYRVDDEEAREWARAEARRKSGLSALPDGPDETEVCLTIVKFGGMQL